MRDKPLNSLLIASIVGVLLVVSWLLGQRYGARQAMSVAASKLSSAEAQGMIDELQSALHVKRSELEAADNLALTNAARAQALAEQLDEQMRRNLVDANDLALYRQIENSEKARSIDIATLKWAADQSRRLELTLVQWQGRDRVSGEMQLSLEYAEEQENVSASPEHIAADAAQESAGRQGLDMAVGNERIQVDLGPMPFDFRFFQNLIVPLPINIVDEQSEISQPDTVIVRITPSDKRLTPVTERFSWNDIAE